MTVGMVMIDAVDVMVMGLASVDAVKAVVPLQKELGGLDPQLASMEEELMD